MVDIKPFRGIRFDSNKIDVAKVITPPYDVISEAEIPSYQKKSQYNFVNVILNKDYKKAGELLRQWQRKKILIQDKDECFYIYSQLFTAGGKEYQRTGFIGLVRLEELGKNILPHEKTLPKPLAGRIDLMEQTKCNEGQVFFIYDDKKSVIDSYLEKVKLLKKPLFSFEDDSHVKHSLWQVNEPEIIGKLIMKMQDSKVVIADGHHRYKAALEFSKIHPEIEGAKYRMATFVNSCNKGLIILPTNRIVYNYNMDFSTLLPKLKEFFDIEQQIDTISLLKNLEEFRLGHRKKNAIGLVDNISKKYYLLKLKSIEIMKKILPEVTENYRQLDVAVLHKLVFEKIMGIDPEKQGSEEIIEFVKGNKESVKRMNDKKYKAAFLINPPSISEVFSTSEAGEVMPQKSTFFYPKLFSGIVIYQLKEE